MIPLGFLTAGVAAPAHAAGTGHYVDCSRNTDGTGSQASPWNSLSSVNAAAFGPGDSILFARGTTCTGALHPAGSGSATATITVDAYGTGALPVIDDSTAADPAAVALTDQSYWDIQNLEIVGGRTYGVHVTGNTANAALHHVHLTDLDVHGATGTSTKRGDSGEVFIYPDAGGETISDVVVNGVTAHDSHVSQGIYIAGAFGAFPAGTVVASPPNGPTGTGVTVENSTAHDVYGDGILLTQVTNGLVQSSVSYQSGLCGGCGSTPSGIWEWYCQTCTLQYDESYANHTWAAYDGGAFDIDNFNANNVLQYDYGHDNDGYCLAVYSGSGYNEPNDVFRYNVCANNQRKSGGDEGNIELSTDPGGASITGLQIYNNTFYDNPADGYPALVQTKATTAQSGFFKNNIIYSTNDRMLDGSGTLTLDNNLYFTTTGNAPTFTVAGTTYTGLAAYQAGTSQDAHSLVADPGLNLVGDHGTGLPARAYTLAPGSPAIGAGTDVCAGSSGCDMGTRDFYGNATATAGAHNIGAYDAPAGVNVVGDPGFETGTCAGWNCYSGAATATGDTHSGTYAVQIPVGGGAEQKISGLSPGSTYTLSGWAKTSVAGQCASLGVKSFDSSGAQKTACLNATSYSRGTVTFTTGPTSTSATVYLWNPTGNTATVRGDDFTLASGWPSWTGTLVSSVAANKCLDIPSSSTTNGSRADISDCTGGANQTFTHTATGALRVYSGSNLKCLDDFNASKSPGAAVGIWTCDSGANQQWVLNPDGTITSPLSGLCLDVTGNKSTNGTPVELWTCTGSANQKWTAQ